MSKGIDMKGDLASTPDIFITTNESFKEYCTKNTTYSTTNQQSFDGLTLGQSTDS
jgi:hypothetical protein